MITQKKMIVPIFDYKLTIVIFDKWEELDRFLPKEEMEQEAKAITISQYGASLVAVNSKRGRSKALDLIADKDGNIDIENILTEMMENLMSTNPFTFKTSFVGDIEIGGGEIKFNLPLTNKRLVLNMTDLETFKEMLITKD